MRSLVVGAIVLYAANALSNTTPDATSPGGSVVDRSAVDECPTRIDYDQPDYVQRPEESCCTDATTCATTTSTGSTYKRWLREEVAVKGPDAVIETGISEVTSVPTSVTIPPTTSTCIGATYTGGERSGAMLTAYIADVTARAQARGLQPPKFFKETRVENMYRETLAALDIPNGITPPSKHWLLRTDRDFFTTINTFLTGGGTSGGCPSASGGSCCPSFCRVPSSGYAYDATDCAADYGGSTAPFTDGGCDDTLGSEGQWSFQTLLYNFENGLEEAAVYSMFFRGGTSQGMFFPVAVVADMTFPAYRTWRIAFEQADSEAQGTTGIAVTLKDHFYWNYITGTGWARQQHWIDMGDGVGGYKITSSSTIDTLEEAVTTSDFADGYSGPPEIKGTGSRCTDTATGCEFAWPEYAYGMAKFMEEARAAGLPTLVRAKAIYYEGCLTSWSPSAANEYDDGLNASTGCKDYHDDPTTVESNCTAAYTPHVACQGNNDCYLNCNEAAMWRSVFSNATHLNVDTQGGRPDDAVTDPPPGSVSGGIGVNAGIGVTYEQLKTMIQGGSPHPDWIRVVDSEDGYRVADKFCADTRETNPETALTP